jgi:hypothetical protein
MSCEIDPLCWKLGGDVYPVDADPEPYPDTLPLELPYVEVLMWAMPLLDGLEMSNAMP